MLSYPFPVSSRLLIDFFQVTQLFQNRLTAYHSACDYLVDYVKTTEKMQHAHAKEYEKVLKVSEKMIARSYK